MLRLCPGWKVCALALPALVMLLGLGVWQLERAAYKRTIEAQYQAASHVGEQALPLDSAHDYAALRYRAVHVDGAFDGDRQFLLDNQIVGGRVGYHVLTPLRTSDHGRAILVDRGWVAQGQTRQLLPDVSVDVSPRRIRGSVYVPFGTGFRLGTLDGGLPGWPRVVQFLDYAAMSERLGYPLLPVIIRLAPEADGGFVRDWKNLSVGPERHLGYAVQWFGLALALAIILLVVANRQNGESGSDSHEF